MSSIIQPEKSDSLMRDECLRVVAVIFAKAKNFSFDLTTNLQLNVIDEFLKSLIWFLEDSQESKIAGK